MTIGKHPICMKCKHRNTIDSDGLTCKAFPNGIPDAIILNEHDHRKPFKGDNGIQFEQVNFKELEEAQFST